MPGAHPLQHLALAALVGVWGPGCRSCSSDSARIQAPQHVVEKAGHTPAPKLQNLVPTSTAVVLRSGSKAWVWVDGRSSALSLAVDVVRWSPGGFEYASPSGFTKVLAPGGSLYYRLGEVGQAESAPLESVLGRPSSPPPGFGIDYVDGAGGSRVQAILTGPEGRRVRLGLFERVPDEQVWLKGEVRVDGKVSPELDASVGFVKDSEGLLQHAIPANATALDWQAVPEADLKRWADALQAFSKDGSPLTVGSANAADLDRDGTTEAIVCLDGAVRMFDPRCVLVDVVGEETRMYGLSLPWTPGGPDPLAFTLGGAPYALQVSSDDARRGFVLRTFGAGWVVDAIR